MSAVVAVSYDTCRDLCRTGAGAGFGALAGCDPGLVSVDVGGDAPVCLTFQQAQAYSQSAPASQTSSSAWLPIAIIGGALFFVVLAVVKH